MLFPQVLKRACRRVTLLGALLLAGCAIQPSSPGTAPPPRDALEAFSLEGRFSLRHEDKNYSGRLSWRHQGANNTLLLASPFGQGMAEITTSESGARLTSSDGKVYAAPDAETLTQQVLGYPLPLARLTDWVRGRGAAEGLAELDAYQRPLRLRHEDWSIDYGYASDDPQAPPNRVFAERVGGFELRLRIDEWNSLPPADGTP
ncbi:lipoprotein insertase outer membrane protein LolB [Propionivibrio sp.]|uniref:lipoprotein insertase outer membrane protein LolB n=1 Tax=Propionivibrio sp. TaxID=2212460 RepID=UPI003BF160B2